MGSGDGPQMAGRPDGPQRGDAGRSPGPSLLISRLTCGKDSGPSRCGDRSPRRSPGQVLVGGRSPFASGDPRRSPIDCVFGDGPVPYGTEGCVLGTVPSQRGPGTGCGFGDGPPSGPAWWLGPRCVGDRGGQESDGWVRRRSGPVRMTRVVISASRDATRSPTAPRSSAMGRLVVMSVGSISV